MYVTPPKLGYLIDKTEQKFGTDSYSVYVVTKWFNNDMGQMANFSQEELIEAMKCANFFMNADTFREAYDTLTNLADIDAVSLIIIYDINDVPVTVGICTPYGYGEWWEITDESLKGHGGLMGNVPREGAPRLPFRW